MFMIMYKASQSHYGFNNVQV